MASFLDIENKARCVLQATGVVHEWLQNDRRIEAVRLKENDAQFLGWFPGRTCFRCSEKAWQYVLRCGKLAKCEIVAACAFQGSMAGVKSESVLLRIHNATLVHI